MEPQALLAKEFEVERRFVGGMGELLVVRDPGTGQRFAAKTIRPDLAEPGLAARFQVEARAWIALGSNENVVEALQFREIEGVPFLFLEYVDGVNGEDLLRASGALPIRQAVEFVAQVLSGLAHAHDVRVREGTQGLVHRDLKPANLLVRRADRRVKITDWGLVKILGATRLTAERTMLGTLRYCAPEQVEDAATADRRADLYACGAILWEAIAGRPVFPGEEIMSVVRAVLGERPRSLSDAAPACPEALSRLAADLLEKDPAARPASAREVAARLAGVALPTETTTACSRCGFLRRPDLGVCPLCESTAPRAVGADAPDREWEIRTRAAGEEVADAVAIAAGDFRFGPALEPRHGAAFSIDRTPVTNARFALFLEQACYRPKHPSGFLRHWPGGKCPRALGEHPVTWISWHDATAYAAWAGARLPTWEEWERAARGTDGRAFPWGREFDRSRCNTREGGLGSTSSVSQFPAGASPDGVLDLLGNVREWTDSWREPDQRRTKVVCGASWASPGAPGLRRVQNLFPDARDHETGFRCVRGGAE